MTSVSASPRFSASDYPALFTSADATSRLGKRSHLRLVRVDLELLVGGAALGVIGSLVAAPYKVWPLVAAAIVLGATMILTSANKVLRYDLDWYEGRAVAESVKAATWRFMMRVQPFDQDDRAAEGEFVTLLRRLLEAQKDLRPAPGGVPVDAQQVTPGVRRLRALPLAERKDCYLQQRVLDQINWYATKSEQNRRIATRWFWFDIVARGAALAFAIVVIVAPTSIPNIAGVFTSLAAAATAWTQLGRHEEISKNYGLAAHELIFLRGAVENAEDDERFGQAVQEVEMAMTREITAWQAKHL